MFVFFENLISPFLSTPRPAHSKSIWAFLWSQTHSVRGLLFAMMVFSGLLGAFESLLFSMIARLVDKITMASGAGDVQGLGATICYLLALLAAGPLVEAMQALLKQQTLGGRYQAKLIWGLHTSVMPQPTRFFNTNSPAKLGFQVVGGGNSLREAIMCLTDMFAFVTVFVVSIVYVIFSLNYLLFLPFAVWALLYTAVFRYFVPRMSSNGALEATERSNLSGSLSDIYSNIFLYKTNPQGKLAEAEALSSITSYYSAAQRTHQQVTLFDIANRVTSALLMGSTVTLSVWLWSANLVGAGAVAASIALAIRMHELGDWCLWGIVALSRHLGVVKDSIATIGGNTPALNQLNGPPLIVSDGAIEFENVHFEFVEGAAVINGVSLRVRAGEKIGIVGVSGSGKSTLINLLLRMYNVKEGKILIDDQDISLCCHESILSAFSVVSQDSRILNRSIRDNLTMGRHDVTDGEIMDAVEKAQMTTFISEVVDDQGRRGLDALLGEGGVLLSGGQRQRISIARALLRNTPIVILDEATSSLDSEAESAIQLAFSELLKGKTVFAVAHRLSTIAEMDLLVVLEKGRVIEMGTHKDLLMKDARYAQLWRLQSEGFMSPEG